MREVNIVRLWVMDHLASLLGIPVFDTLLPRDSSYPCIRMKLEPLTETFEPSDEVPSLNLRLELLFGESQEAGRADLINTITGILAGIERPIFPAFKMRLGEVSLERLPDRAIFVVPIYLSNL